MHSISFLLRATGLEWKLAPQRWRYYVSLETHGRVCCKWAAIHCNRWRNSSTSGWYFTSDGRQRRMIHWLEKLMEFCVSFITLWSLNRSFQTPQSWQFLNVFVPILTYGHWSLILGYDWKYIISSASGRNGTFAKSLRCGTSWQSVQLWNSQCPECWTGSLNREIWATLVQVCVQNAPRKTGETSPAG